MPRPPSELPSEPTSSATDAAEAPADLACSSTSLRRAARRLGQLYDEAIAPSGLTSPQALLLAQVDALAGEWGGDGPPLKILASRLAVGVSAVTHALRPLVRDGLIEVRSSPRDRRTKHARLTPLGRERHATMYTLWAQANRRVETVLGPESAETLRRLADTVASDAFSEAYASDTPLAT